jgi:hypothetical protein
LTTINSGILWNIEGWWLGLFDGDSLYEGLRFEAASVLNSPGKINYLGTGIATTVSKHKSVFVGRL